MTTTKQACELLGAARASVYRARTPPILGPFLLPLVGVQPNALTAAERAEILAVLNSDRFADKSPAQTWAVCLDEGVYLGSVSTMYRVLRSDGPVRERRAQATHPARVRPELMADGPDQVWSWDIERHEAPFDRVVMKGHRLRLVAAGRVKLRAA